MIWASPFKPSGSLPQNEVCNPNSRSVDIKPWMKTSKDGHGFWNKKESPKQGEGQGTSVGQLGPVTVRPQTGHVNGSVLHFTSCSQLRGPAASGLFCLCPVFLLPFPRKLHHLFLRQLEYLLLDWCFRTAYVRV